MRRLTALAVAGVPAGFRRRPASYGDGDCDGDGVSVGVAVVGVPVGLAVTVGCGVALGDVRFAGGGDRRARVGRGVVGVCVGVVVWPAAGVTPLAVVDGGLSHT